MSIFVYTMATAKAEKGLLPRLERLTGSEASCCVPEYRDLAKSITGSRSFDTAVGIAHALADSSRMLAVAMLRRRNELCACEIQVALGVTHATVSHHMRLLTKAGIVSAERRGKWMYYRLARDPGALVP